RAPRICGRGGFAMSAISGIGTALGDRPGKLRGARVSGRRGGPPPTRLPAYASLLRYETPDAVAGACRHFVAQGFRMLKLHQTDVASVRAAREAVGPDVELMLATNRPWTPIQAIHMARPLRPYRLSRFDEAR